MKEAQQTREINTKSYTGLAETTGKEDPVELDSPKG